MVFQFSEARKLPAFAVVAVCRALRVLFARVLFARDLVARGLVARALLLRALVSLVRLFDALVQPWHVLALVAPALGVRVRLVLVHVAGLELLACGVGSRNRAFGSQSSLWLLAVSSPIPQCVSC